MYNLKMFIGCIFLLSSMMIACSDSESTNTSTENSGSGNCNHTGGFAGNGGSLSGGSGGSGGTGGIGGSDITPPTVILTEPEDGAINVALNRNIVATFNEPMNCGSLNELTISLVNLENILPTGISCDGSTVVLVPNSDLLPNEIFTVVITTGVMDLAGNTMVSDYTWNFETGTNLALGPDPVNLGTAGNFVILAKSGVDTIPTSAITGDVGVSPIDSTALTGFSLSVDSSNTFATSSQVVGKLFAADYTPPTPSNLTTAVSDMEAAFTAAAGIPLPDFTELAAGDISGLTMVPGLYKWGTGILISTDVYLNGGPNDVWVFQISGGITQASGAAIHLTGGAQAKNVFWQTYGAVALDTSAHMEGIILSQTEITLATGATINGRLLSQTAVTLDASTVVQP